MITLEKALQAIKASEAKAKDFGFPVSTVIVDEHGTMIAMQKMDGALLISPNFALAKAFTAAMLKSPTEGLGEYAKEGNPYFGITTILGGKMTPIPGGVPVKQGEKVIGGVGVGGSMDPKQDAVCAQEAATVLAG